MYLIDNKRFKIKDSLPYPNHHFRYGDVHTHKPKPIWHPENKTKVRNRAMTNCMRNPECIGLEIDSSGKREIREVIMNPNKWMYRDPEGIYDGTNFNIPEIKRLLEYIKYGTTNKKPTFDKYISNDNNTNIIIKTCMNADAQADNTIKNYRWCSVGDGL